MKNIVNECIKEYYKLLNKKLLIKEDFLEDRYLIQEIKNCEIKNCKENIINNEKYCKDHYNLNMVSNNKEKNKDIYNTILKKNEEYYEDMFGIKFSIKDNKLILF